LEKYLAADFRPLSPKITNFRAGLYNSLCYRRIGGKKIMASDKQIEANRRNAQLSTGPKTEAGKARSALNALKHGMRSKNAMEPFEDNKDYLALLADLLQEHQPQTVTEQLYVERMAITQARIILMEADLAEPIEKDWSIQSLIPYLQQIEKLERAFDRSLTQLRKLQKDRRAEPREAREPERPKAAKRPPQPQPQPDPRPIPSAPPRSVDQHADPPLDPIQKAS
jgi:hypothetical protein